MAGAHDAERATVPQLRIVEGAPLTRGSRRAGSFSALLALGAPGTVMSLHAVRATGLALMAVALVLVLGGCASGGGLSPLDARDRVEAAPGVVSATVTTGEEQRTLQTTTFIRVRLQLEDVPDTADLSRLIEYVSRVGWATRIGHAPTGMQLDVSSPSGVDVHAVLEDLGVASSPGFSDASVLVSAKAMNSKWGRWPCDVPEPLR